MHVILIQQNVSKFVFCSNIIEWQEIVTDTGEGVGGRMGDKMITAVLNYGK